ncbi:replicative DNA helicase [uncultured Nocardioides sp.]|uniref:replicative DNA helicase n=1 Tax=uncultured Nocardioides sp. TaxID=198441 RepID=UPI00261AD20A|nr:replicative DNA helicase [uncultured Nocardioides sp.]
MAAEQSVLGSMMISKDAIADVVEAIKGTDYYRPSHEIIHDAIIDLYGRGDPVDPITVADTLGRRGELQRVGGAPYLHTLTSTVPIALNAGYYAEIVREKAILRRLVEAGTKIVQIGYAGEGQVDAVVDEAQAEVYKVTERRAAEDYVPLSAIMEGVLDEIEAIGNRETGLYGVPTGFADLDGLTNGLHSGQMIIVAARPAMGKALALGTPLPTPEGWTTMGEVAVGDQLLDGAGDPTTVVATTEVMERRPCYEVVFSDGSRIVADAEHLWLTTIAGSGRSRVRTTDRIRRSLDSTHVVAMPDGSEMKIENVYRVRSVPVRCVQVDNDEALYLAGHSMIPTHNSTLALDLCRAASIANNMTSVFFSLEMNRSEITMRLLSAEAMVPLNSIRTGQLTDADWQKLARKMGEVSSAPFFIDDSPNMTMMEIRAKARRLKQRHDLKLIVIDYMQLMSSGRKVESRQLEVSEFSRQIKLLAKELEVPIIALSQLNRGAEQRSDKRPMMSDLRESGCLTAETRLMRADTNAEVSLGELLASGATDVPVWALDDRLALVPRTLTHAFPSGTKPVYAMTTASGRVVHATANHRFLTVDGWRPLGCLRLGTPIAAARHVPPPRMVSPRPDAEVEQTARLLGQESLRRRSLLPEGLRRVRNRDKFVPDWVFGLPSAQLTAFLRHLFATPGTAGFADGLRPLTSYGAVSRRLVDDVARLLLRFNVTASVTRVPREGLRDAWCLAVDDADDQLRFLEKVGVTGSRETEAAFLAAMLRANRPEPEDADTPLADRLSAAATEVAPGGTATLPRVVDVLEDEDLEVVATNDVRWDPVVSIEAVGEQPVYDATVMGLHNFVADGLAAHNSLEQDADMVILLHREDAYEKESARPGEADVIVAKHRNGPTRDIVVAFQGHYSRFVDMAHG